jgi:hypothetical protein
MVMNEPTYVIEFSGASSADANRYAEELRSTLLKAAPEAKVERQRADPESQDFGATLVLVLGTPVAVVLANAFRDWLNRRNQVILTIKSPDGDIVLQNVTAKHALKVMELFAPGK